MNSNKEKKLRYSKKDRDEFKKIILIKLTKAEKDLIVLKESFVNDKNNGTDDTSPTFKAFEEGSETLSKEQNAQLIAHVQRLVRDLKMALIRVNSKDYGICRIMGKLIPKKRLMLIPHTTLSIEGISKIEQKK